MTTQSGSGVGELGRTRARARVGRRLMTAALFTAAVGPAGCGQTTTISVSVFTSAGAADPFLSATSVRMTQGTNQVSAAVTGGKFQVNLNLDAPPTDQYIQILVEGLDSSGNLVARGVTPSFSSQTTAVSVYVNRPGQVGSTDLQLPDDMVTVGSARGRRELMGAALSGAQTSPAEPAIGALIVGGAADDGSLINEAVMYKTLNHQLIDAGSPSAAGQMSTGRRGGVMVATSDATAGQQAVVWGGAQSAGMLPTHADKFDPAVSTLSQVWALPDPQYRDAGTPGAYLPSVGQVGTLALVCGGLDKGPGMAGVPQQQAVLIRRNPPAAGSTDQTALVGVTRVMPTSGMGPMVAARYLHTVTGSADGGTGLVFGGLSAADSATKPVAEVYSIATNAFTAFPLTPAPAPASRRGHVAARLTSGQFLIVGGYTGDTPSAATLESSSLIIEPVSGVTTTMMNVLKTPRYAASIATSGGELVICGGFGADGKALKDCEALSATSGMPTRAGIALPNARAGHLALTLENGLTLLVGGVADPAGPALSSIDIYSALQ